MNILKIDLRKKVGSDHLNFIEQISFGGSNHKYIWEMVNYRAQMLEEEDTELTDGDLIRFGRQAVKISVIKNNSKNNNQNVVSKELTNSNKELKVNQSYTDKTIICKNLSRG
jgi:hypothetical protein